ncbi:Gfo/Idh/MocA family protein [Plantactinospora sp. GCM10030261]|uniref:Gfo/Idh/MocA family protein n=1 Tax=Plantactinospora sp. GCM10030261 TaxID=3273420 RepID=UPI00360B6826
MTFRWAILGTGPVARKFVLGLRYARDAAPVVVASRDRANAERFGRELGIDRVAADYTAAIESGVDACYLATPPNTHAALAVRCLERGVPVLVEKPFTATRPEAESVRDTARRHGVFCMEGMWTRFLPAVREVKRLVDAGDLGRVRGFTGGFCLPARVDPGRSVFRPDLAGGALLHRAVYPISLAIHLLGRPAETQGMVDLGPTGVDEQAVVTARHPGGGLSVARASLRSAGPNDCWVTGEHGVAHLHGPIYRPSRLSVARIDPTDPDGSGRWARWRESSVLQGLHQLRDRVTGGPLHRAARTTTLRYTGNGYHYEADEVRRCVAAGLIESPVMPLSDSVAVLAAVDRTRMEVRLS